MKTIIALCILVNTAINAYTQGPPTLTVIRQDKLPPQTLSETDATRAGLIFPPPLRDTPTGDLKVRFRLLNENSRSIVVYGVGTGAANFQPFGFLSVFDQENNRWSDPSAKRGGEQDRYLLTLDKLVLEPGSSIEFSVLLNSSADKGKRFRQSVKYTGDGCNHISTVYSPGFSISDTQY